MVALDDVCLDLHPGERLALVGENGAGKSSLMNVLYGLYQPDAGELFFDGMPVRLRSPRDAIARGVGMVHQHFMLVPTLSVAENVVLGMEPTRRGLFDLDAANAQVEKTCRRFGFRLDPRAKVESLTVGSQQKVEIVKALHRGAKTLILDEPTAVLTPQEADELFAVTRELSATGHTVVFITHKLKEVLSVATRIAVMRRGKRVGERQPTQVSAEALAELMVGDSGPLSPWERAGVRGVSTPGTPVLSLEELSSAPLQQISLEVHSGEIVGIAGVDGNGQRELAEVVTGLRPWTSGRLTLSGEALSSLTPGEARRRGVAHVPEDRLLRAVVGAMTVEENFSLGRQASPPFARHGLIDFPSRRARAQALIADYDIRPANPGAQLKDLSGGNQQKVVVARELDTQPRLLVVVQPTRGLDIAAVAQVHARLREARHRGTAVLLVSLDLEEVFALCDRVYVLYDGRASSPLSRAELDERKVGRMMLGTEATHG
ncbi:MAG: ABC transporter ATP-binding protein [Myxococcota bacterium]